jgi:hypothetical protein
VDQNHAPHSPDIDIFVLRPGGGAGLDGRGPMVEAKANWLGKENLESRLRGAFQPFNEMTPRHRGEVDHD